MSNGIIKQHLFMVRVPAVTNKRDCMKYVLEAARGWGGGYAKGDPFASQAERKQIVVKPMIYDIEKEALKALKAKVDRYFKENELPSGIYCDVMGIIDGQIEGKS